jgi:hypothetical protein
LLVEFTPFDPKRDFFSLFLLLLLSPNLTTNSLIPGGSKVSVAQLVSSKFLFLSGELLDFSNLLHGTKWPMPRPQPQALEGQDQEGDEGREGKDDDGDAEKGLPGGAWNDPNSQR